MLQIGKNSSQVPLRALLALKLDGSSTHTNKTSRRGGGVGWLKPRSSRSLGGCCGRFCWPPVPGPPARDGARMLLQPLYQPYWHAVQVQQERLPTLRPPRVLPLLVSALGQDCTLLCWLCAQSRRRRPSSAPTSGDAPATAGASSGPNICNWGCWEIRGNQARARACPHRLGTSCGDPFSCPSPAEGCRHIRSEGHRG